MISELLIFLALSSSLISAQDVKCRETEECITRSSCRDGMIGWQSCNEESSMICCKKPVPVKCGASIVLSARIIGSDKADFAEFPWNVGFLKDSSEFVRHRNNFYCGGALIHPKVVLTVAHCLFQKDPSKLVVRAGQLDITDTALSSLDFKDLAVEKVIIHEDYNNNNLFNDIALVIMKEEFPMQDNIGIICLPSTNTIFDDKTCDVSGFGNNFDFGGLPTNLRKAKLFIHSQNECNNKLRKTELSEFFVLNESFICAEGEVGVDTCKGDGGSPLVCQTTEDFTRYTLAGLVSWGLDCAKENVPGAYVNVAKFRNWVDQKLSENFIPVMHAF